MTDAWFLTVFYKSFLFNNLWVRQNIEASVRHKIMPQLEVIDSKWDIGNASTFPPRVKEKCLKNHL